MYSISLQIVLDTDYNSIRYVIQNQISTKRFCAQYQHYLEITLVFGSHNQFVSWQPCAAVIHAKNGKNTKIHIVGLPYCSFLLIEQSNYGKNFMMHVIQQIISFVPLFLQTNIDI